MQEETIEEKIRKIQGLFADQVEIRIGSDTEDGEGVPVHKIWWCDLVYVDDDYKDHQLYFHSGTMASLIDNISSSDISFATETTLKDAIDGLYCKCVNFINSNYYASTYEFKIIAIASSAVSQ